MRPPALARRFQIDTADQDLVVVYKAAAMCVGLAAAASLAGALTDPRLRGRERSVSAVVEGGLALLAAQAARDTAWWTRIARLHPARFAGVLGFSAVAGPIAGGVNSPQFLSSVMLTAMGAGVTRRPNATRYAALISTGYVLSELAASPLAAVRNRPGWAIVVPITSLVNAGRIGARVGDLSLRLRALEDQYLRDAGSAAALKAGVDDLRGRAQAFDSLAARLEPSLLKAADPEAAATLSRLRQSRVDVRAALARLGSDQRGFGADLARTIRQAGQRLPAGTVSLRSTSDLPNRVPQAVYREVNHLIWLALDNVYDKYAETPSNVEVSVVLAEQVVSIVVTDVARGCDAASTMQALDQTDHSLLPHGHGLAAARMSLRLLGGDLHLQVVDDGARVAATIPLEPSPFLDPALVAEGSRARDVVRAVSASLRDCRRTTIAHAAAHTLLDDDSRSERPLPAATRVALSTVIAGELVDVLSSGRSAARARAALLVVASSMGSWDAKLPLSGWAASVVGELAWQGDQRASLLVVATTSALSAARGRWPKTTRGRAFTAGWELGFPLMCAVLVLYARKQLSTVVEWEATVGSPAQRERAAMDFAEEFRLIHLIANQVVEAAAATLPDHEASKELRAEARAASQAAAQLQHTLSSADELDVEALLGGALARRLSPLGVDVYGSLPPVRRPVDPVSAAGRYAQITALVNLLDQVGDWFQSAYPPTASASPILSAVVVRLETSERALHVSVRPVMRSRPHRDSSPSVDAVERALAEMGGVLTRHSATDGLEFELLRATLGL